MKAKADLMVLKAESKRSQFDWLKWLLVLVLLLAGIVGNHYYNDVSMAPRVVGWLALLLCAGLIATWTQKGQWVIGFFRDSKAELRKVVWPTREEVTQTTLVVGVMVIILALILWGMDGILVWLIGWLTGQRG